MSSVGATDFLGGLYYYDKVIYSSNSPYPYYNGYYSDTASSDGTGNTMCSLPCSGGCQTAAAAPEQAVGIFPAQGSQFASGFTSGG